MKSHRVKAMSMGEVKFVVRRKPRAYKLEYIKNATVE